MSRHIPGLTLFAVLFLVPSTLFAEILDILQMETDGQATITASPWDIGDKNALFDGNWTNVYRSAAVNPVVVTIEFDTAISTGAARGKFTHTTTHDWTLEAADTVADLDSKTGTYTKVFGPTRVTGENIQWTEWNDTPVTRQVFRFTIYRVYGDNYVHISELELQTPEPVEEVEVNGEIVRVNVIQIDTGTGKVAEQGTLPCTAIATLSYGPDEYDVTDQCTWSVDDENIATIDQNGVVTGVAQGQTTIRATLGVIQSAAPLTVRPRRPVDLDVGFIHRTPEYNRFVVSYDGDPHIHPNHVDEKKWPDPGETVTYTAHIFNRGDDDVQNVVYRWYFDDSLVDEGTISQLAGISEQTVSYSAPWPADTVQTISLEPGAMELHPKQLERAIGDHRIRIEIDPDDTITETCDLNNILEDYINALTFWIFMDETTYAFFTNHPNFIESLSPENWARMQLIGLERRLRVAGCPQKLRLDMLAVYPDGELSSGGTHEPIGSQTWQADGRWGFQINEWPESKVVRFAKIVENPLMHEWGHQIGLIDVYQYDITIANCHITYQGSAVAGTSLFPGFSNWNIFFGGFRLFHENGNCLTDNTQRAVMADTSRRYLSNASAAGMNRNLGLRRGFFGDYLGAVQQGDIKLKVRHLDGTPVAGCGIRVFPRSLDARVHDNPKFSGTTDTNGEWIFPDQTLPGWESGMAVNNPWSYIENGVVHDTPNVVGQNAPMIVELTFDSTVEYHIITVDECNIAMQQGINDNYTFDLITYQSRAGNTLPTISFNGAPDVVQLNENEFFEATVSATDADSDDVTLQATPLYNSTFNPDTGRFTFRPDSLQVNRYDTYTEPMYVNFIADDGKFVEVKRMEFQVSDIPDVAVLDETDDDGDGAGNLADPDDDNDGVDDGTDQCPGTIAGMPVDAVGCPIDHPCDFDNDGDVDNDDVSAWEACVSAPAIPVTTACESADLDGDDDADQSDFALLQRCYTGPDIPADINCAVFSEQYSACDFDQDLDVDATDMGHIDDCTTGPGIPQEDPNCQDAKMDADEDVDQTDYGICQQCFSGQNNPADPGCP